MVLGQQGPILCPRGPSSLDAGSEPPPPLPRPEPGRLPAEPGRQAEFPFAPPFPSCYFGAVPRGKAYWTHEPFPEPAGRSWGCTSGYAAGASEAGGVSGPGHAGAAPGSGGGQPAHPRSQRARGAGSLQQGRVMTPGAGDWGLGPSIGSVRQEDVPSAVHPGKGSYQRNLSLEKVPEQEPRHGQA